MTAAQTRSSVRATILYEDRRGPTRDFKLHELVLAAVHDTLVDRGPALQPHVLTRRLIAIPKKSDSKVLAAIQQDADQLHGGRHAIVAWLDDDKIHVPLALDRRAASATKIAAIRARAPLALQHRPGALAVALVRGNLEAFLRRIDAAQPGALSRASFAAAIDKDLTARDLCLSQIAAPRNRAWRTALRRLDPGFDCVVRYLACLATYEPWPPW